ALSAQVRFTLGFIRKPASSAITISPLPAALFLKVPASLFAPRLDLRFVAFPGSTHRLLVREAQFLENHADVVVVVADVELAEDQIGDQLLGPKISVKAQLLRVFKQ